KNWIWIVQVTTLRTSPAGRSCTPRSSGSAAAGSAVPRAMRPVPASTMARPRPLFRKLVLDHRTLVPFELFNLEFEFFKKERVIYNQIALFFFSYKLGIVSVSIGSCTVVHGLPSPNSFSSLRN